MKPCNQCRFRFTHIIDDPCFICSENESLPLYEKGSKPTGFSEGISHEELTKNLRLEIKTFYDGSRQYLAQGRWLLSGGFVPICWYSDKAQAIRALKKCLRG